jgi:hypothetical protein
MNPDDSNDRLLDALLVDHAALEAMRSAGLATVRRRRWRQAARIIFAGAAAAVLVISAAHVWRDSDHKVEQVQPSQHAAASLAPATRELTDDELLRQFPPGTCTLAEINGQKTLVFLTDEAQANYLR